MATEDSAPVAASEQQPTTTTSQPTAETQSLPIRSQEKTASGDFDIVAEYHSHLRDHEFTKPVAAIEALVALLAASSYTTVFETLETAGTDLFLQYLVSSLKQQEGQTAAPGGGTTHHQSFEDVLRHLVRNGRLFADRAIAARDGIADAGWRFVREGKTVLTMGESRAVEKLLFRAAAQYPAGAVNFRVVYVREARRPDESDRFVAALRARGIPVAEISELAIAHVMALRNSVHMVFVGAEAVTQSGGIISRLGTYQIAKLARENKPRIPFYVTAETHKFVRNFPLGQKDLGYDQTVLDFQTDRKSDVPVDAVDYTPPEYITNLVTENGPKLPGYVLEQLLEIYGALNG
ncbi:Translation initiation factor eIF-2B subunit alpha like protein [Verticillium longisporum]|uniref:Translation initiation factor eIF-2B subunit alpha like protein n=1 Tax=Verticillium longisporum TaxID=100787 RepID=A0A8I2ZNF5_VERLO|nr:Translation initiation factor eIF-2B subunit alpha like protein [Verticillium longisporum]